MKILDLPEMFNFTLELFRKFRNTLAYFTPVTVT
jgi:hypothetical protein